MTLAAAEDIVAFEQEDGQWSLTVNNRPKAALDTALEAGANITSWAPVRPNLVEWLCAATGMNVDDVSLEVASSALLPMRSMEVKEDE